MEDETANPHTIDHTIVCSVFSRVNWRAADGSAVNEKFSVGPGYEDGIKYGEAYNVLTSLNPTTQYRNLTFIKKILCKVE